MATRSTSKPAPKSGGTKHLVIVESPAKARTIGRYLGNGYEVKASMGHVRDLPQKQFGVAVERDFAPRYEVMADKRKVIADLKKAADGAGDIYLATDPDREGEAISWHLLKAAGWEDRSVKRVVFHQITPDAIKEAFAGDRSIDMRLVNAQQARRILDRIVGYPLSRLLWSKVQGGLSAGRVQSVALRLVVERDREIEAFQPVEYWSIEAALQAKQGGPFTASYFGAAGEKKRRDLPRADSAAEVVRDLQNGRYSVANVTKRETKRGPWAPFITSTLQQEAWRQLRFSARKTMSVAQQLYEGVDLGAQGSIGLITYMRTDSPTVAAVAVNEARAYIGHHWGDAYVPSSPRRYTARSKVAQEAHEAVRPTSVARNPASVRGQLTSDQFRLYDLIWKRMVASQMADAVLDSTSLDIEAQGASQTHLFRAAGSVVKFPGFRVLYTEAKDEEKKPADDTAEPEADDERTLPPVSKGDALQCSGLTPEQHFTQPPPRYTEASLIRALEDHGIGRPSTYAPTISTIVDRQYVERERGALKSTKLGQVVADQLSGHFPDIMDLDFTAKLEDQLDDVANGTTEWVPLLRDFYSPFKAALERAREKMPKVRVEEPTDEVCEKCERPMVMKVGRFGPFLGCSGFPDCRNIRRVEKNSGVPCPKCGGNLVERRSRNKMRGRTSTFWGCSNYPACDFLVNRAPLPQPCPECEGLLVSDGRNRARCTNCAYRGQVLEDERDPTPAG